MELSICIPVFNENVTAMVNTLIEQSKTLDVETEFLIYDDASENYFKTLNIDIIPAKNLIYKELEENIGRSAIRNKLAHDARGKHLLFLDCDSGILSPSFLKKYLNYTNYDVVVGGRIYPSKCPHKKKKLHWKYGTEKESKNAELRNTSPYKSFHSNNFMIKKDIFNHIQFNEKLKNYGHEDTYFGFELETASIKIFHIENPVLHEHLEDSIVFLSKTEMSLDNLLKLHSINKDFAEKMTLLKILQRMEKSILMRITAWWFKKRAPYLRNNLTSDTPSLRKFNTYKIGYLCFMRRKQQKSA